MAGNCTNIRDGSLITDDQHLGAARNRHTVGTPRAAGPARTRQGENDLTSASLDNRAAKPARHADQVIIGGVKILVFSQQAFSQKQENECRSGQTAGNRRKVGGRQAKPEIFSQHKPGAPKPCDEGRNGAGIKTRNGGRPLRRLGPIQPRRASMNSVDMHVEASRKGGQYAETEAHEKAEQVDVREPQMR